MRPERLQVGLRIMLVLGILLSFPAHPVFAQYGAELEVERDARATTTRLEVLEGRFYAFRAEQVRSAGIDTERLGISLPGPLIGLGGYASLFLERRPSLTGYGTNFELSRGPLALGGSLERARGHFTGTYVKMLGGNFDVGFGGGKRDAELIWHGAAYAKGTRFTLAAGGSVGPGDTSYQHVAGAWRPEERGRGYGAWFKVERDGPGDYLVELNFADKPTFDYRMIWGSYGMDQSPHERNFEALGDPMRYFRPSTRNHERSGGAGVLSARYEEEGGQPLLTLDAILFPFRILRGETFSSGENLGQASGPRNLPAELLRGLMIGFAQGLHGSRDITLMGELRLDPITLYAELETGAETNTYLFLQYVVRGGL